MKQILLNHKRIRMGIVTILLSLFCMTPSHAQGFGSTSYLLEKKQYNKFIYETSSDVPTAVGRYSAMQSTIYQPFTSSMSAKSESKFINLNVGITTYGLISPSDPLPPKDNPNGPVGEAWCMLVFAAMAAVVVYMRQRKQAVEEK